MQSELELERVLKGQQERSCGESWWEKVGKERERNGIGRDLERGLK